MKKDKVKMKKYIKEIFDIYLFVIKIITVHQKPLGTAFKIHKNHESNFS